MTRVAAYRDLVVWQKAMNSLDARYDISETWPQHERYRITDQLRRSAQSVSAKIAEGQGRRGSEHSCIIFRLRTDRWQTQNPGSLLYTEGDTSTTPILRSCS